MHTVFAMSLPLIFSGTWSVITLLCMVVTVVVSTILGIVLLLTALTGGFSKKQPQEPLPPMQGSLSKAYHDAAIEIAAERAGLSQNTNPFGNTNISNESVPESESPAENSQSNESSKTKSTILHRILSVLKRIYKAKLATGLWHILTAFLAFIPSLMFWNWVDSPSGYSVTFTLGAGLNLAVLLLQFILIGMYARKRKESK